MCSRMRTTSLGLLLALAACASAKPLPKFDPLPNEGAPKWLYGLYLADVPYEMYPPIPGETYGADNETFLSTLMFTPGRPYEVSMQTYYPSFATDVEGEGGEEEEDKGKVYTTGNITSWGCLSSSWDSEPDGLNGTVLLIVDGVKRYGDSSAPAETGQWCWMISMSEDGQQLRRHVARTVDSQSSEQGPYNTNCPGRVHGGAILFPTIYRAVPNKAFPSPVENPCLVGV